MNKLKKISSKKIFVNEYVQLYVDKVKTPDGKIIDYYQTYKNQRSVFILPVDNIGRILILKEYRYPVDKVVYGAVAGKIDGKESPLATAKRELKEETGYKAKTMKPLGKFYAAPAKSNTLFYAYVAHGLTKGDTNLDSSEIIKAEWVTTNQFEEMIKQGKIMAPYLMDLYLLYKLKFKK